MPKYYLLDDSKNKIEVENIEGNLYRTILAKIHSDLNNKDYAIEFVTQAQYNQLEADGELVANTYYFITDDATAEDIEKFLNQLNNSVNDLSDLVNNHTNLINGKVDNNVTYENIDERITQRIINDATNGVIVDIDIDDNYHLPYYSIQVNKEKLELKAKSYNHGDNDDNWETKLTIKPNSMTITKTIGDEEESFDLFDALNFKQGTFVVSGVSSENITTNSIKKKGKYVIANLIIAGANVTSSNPLTITIPSDLLPKENTTIAYQTQNSGLAIPYYNTATIGSTNPTITISPSSGAIVAITIINTGWEVA